jgi:hypothetical protein
MERDPKDRGSGSRKISDASIFDAIPPGAEIVAADIAQGLGYASRAGRGGSSAALMSRLRRMNQRAAKQGVPQPFIFGRRQIGAGGPSVTVRRNPEVKSDNG